MFWSACVPLRTMVVTFLQLYLREHKKYTCMWYHIPKPFSLCFRIAKREAKDLEIYIDTQYITGELTDLMQCMCFRIGTAYVSKYYLHAIQ